MRVAVIGAGMTGLTCARALADAGVEVTVLEKARGAGGRLSSRRTDHGGFDHGAGVLRREEVRDVPGVDLMPFEPRRAETTGGSEALLVAAPTASALPKALAAGLDVRPASHVAPFAPDGLRLQDLGGAPLGTFDRVVVTAPPAQVAELLARRSPTVASRAAQARMLPCWTAMLALPGAADLPFDAVADHGPIRWAVAETAKPGRTGAPRWTVQATAAFSQEHLEDPPEAVADALLAALGEASREAGGPTPGEPVLRQAHRWRYARVGEALPEPLLRDDAAGILAGGDWCTPAGADGPAAGTVAAAQVAGAALAAALLR